jgi:GrpB-like predicted nucleotidyltransferase (UPF0157 family)
VLLDDEVLVVGYDVRWPVMFESVAARLGEALGDNVVRVDHIGSTAVPGLWAKPIIDVNLGLAPAGSFHVVAAESCGAVFRAVNPESVLFAFYEGRRRVANVHVRRAGSEAERWDLVFRDFLRNHPAVVEEYGAVKRSVAGEYPGDRDAYSRAKAPFIAGLAPDIEAWALSSGWSP